MAVSFFVCGFGNILNDLCDIESDRINHPHRVLPSGRLTVGRARVFGFYFMVISLVLLFWLSLPGKLIVLMALVLLVWYNFRLKHTAYWGNLTVSILAGLAFIQGGAVAGFEGIFVLPGAVVPAAFAILMHSGREIIKDVEDISGDSLSGSRTAPVKSGSRWPLSMAYFVFTILIICSIVVYLLGWYNSVYMAITTGLVILPLIGQIFWLGLSPDRTRCHLVGTLVKLEMLPGILALIIGRAY